MAIEMIMPKVDMDQETGTVVEWLKSNGQNVEEGETILVIETDKIAIDVEAPGTGILNGISANPGDVLPIGTVIAYILAEGEDLPDLPAGTVSSPAVSAPTETTPDSTPKDIAATPVAKKMAEASAILAKQPGGFKLREIQNLSEMSKEESAMIIIYPSDSGTAQRIASAGVGLAGQRLKKFKKA